MKDPSEKAASSIAAASLYGCGFGAAVVSYLLRSGIFDFSFQKPYEGSVTIIDALDFPKQQDIFFYTFGILVPLIFAAIFGFFESRRNDSASPERELKWWNSLAIFAISSPLLMLQGWPGAGVAIVHLVSLIVLPIIIIKVPLFGSKPETSDGGAEGGTAQAQSAQNFGADKFKWLVPLIQVSIIAFWTHTFKTMRSSSISHFFEGIMLWSVFLAFFFAAVFKALSRFFPSDRPFLDRLVWGLIPFVIMPLYQFAWGEKHAFAAFFIVALVIGCAIFIRTPSFDPIKAAMAIIPLGIGMTLQFSPHYRFCKLDLVHEGQQYAFAECIMRGMLPGVEKAVKYGPLMELTEGWTMMIFGAQMWIMRIYFLCAQVAGYWFGCVLILVAVRRKWLVVYGWYAYLVLTIAALWHPGNFNGMRAGFAILAICFLAVRNKTGNIKWLIPAGMAGATGAVYSIDLGVPGALALGIGVLAGVLGQRENLKKALVAEIAWFFAGVMIVAIPFTALYAARGGVMSLITGIFEHAKAFQRGYGAFPMPNFPWLDRPELAALGAPYFIKRINMYMVPIIVIPFGAWLISRFFSKTWTAENGTHVALLAYAVLGFRSTLGRSDYVHNLNSMAPVAVMILIAADRLLDSIAVSRLSGAKIKTALAALSVAVLIAIPAGNIKYAKETLTRYISHHTYKNNTEIEKFYTSRGMIQFKLERAKGIWGPAGGVKQLEATTDYIVKNTRPDERLHIAPVYGIFFFFADRLPLTRYCLPFDAILPEARASIIETLKREKPIHVFIQHNRGMDYSYDLEHPDEMKYIKENYNAIEKIGETTVYQIKEPGEL